MEDKRRITVLLGAEKLMIGELIFEVQGDRQHSAFRYQEAWLSNPQSFALSPTMPLKEGWTPFAGDGRNSLPPPIGDTSPDEWGRGVILASVGRFASELDILLASNDHTRTGALRFADEQGQIQSSEFSTVPHLSHLSELSNLSAQFEQGIGERSVIARALRGSGDSLGGARPKSTIYDGSFLAIAKFTSNRDTMPVERMEVATLNLAKEVGLRASQARLQQLAEHPPIAVIRRFDRDGDKRIHYISGQSFLSIAHPAEPTFYTDFVDAMRRYGGNYLQVHAEIRELYRRVMFMILVSSADDHMKNHGFLLSGLDRWTLSPAFDINPQPHKHKQLKTGISELSGNEASIEALIDAAPFFDLKQDEATKMVFEMANVIQNEWRSLCAEVGMSANEIKNYRPAFEHPEMTKALAYG